MSRPRRSDTQEARLNDARVRAWLKYREPLERQLEPLGRAAMAQLAPQPGERVLDIGFGIGTTPFALGQAVMPNGEVIGIDMLQAAGDIMRADARCLSRVSFMHGDAEVYPFAPGSFDAAFSRFGVMLFSNPVAAFANIRRALRPNGRIAFICWRSLFDNELDALPIRAAAPCLPAQLVIEAETAAHFSFADPAFVREVLTRAGYVAIDIRQHDEKVRSGSLREMLDVCSRVGSLGAILRDHPEYRDEAVSALEKTLMPLDGPEGPALRAATLIVLAHAL